VSVVIERHGFYPTRLYVRILGPSLTKVKRLPRRPGYSPRARHAFLMPPPKTGFLLQGGYEVSATCGDWKCRRRKTLDLKALAIAHGETAVHVDLAKRFRCKCGHRGAELSIVPGEGRRLRAPAFVDGRGVRDEARS
jgi:hypothetical protein